MILELDKPIGLFYLLLELVGITLAIDVIMRGRTPQGTVAWAVALVMMPMLSIPCYLIFGSRRFIGYVRALRKGKERIHDRARQLREDLGDWRIESRAPELTAFERLARLPFTHGNRTKLLIDGEATFAAIFAAIEAAQTSVLVQYYTVQNDGLGNRLRELLERKAKQGVEVLFIADRIGSAGLPESYLKSLRLAGAEAEFFRTKKFGTIRYQINFRNHRKIVVVDGRIGFVGGLNVGDEYLGLVPALSPWRDTHLEIEGPAVKALQLAFAEDWHWITGRLPQRDWTCPPPSAGSGGEALIIATGPADELESCSLLFGQAIARARKRLWIACPYFVPENDILHALQLAALRGVEVRVLIPSRSDNPLVRLSAYSYFEEAGRAGVRFWRWKDGFMHQKVVLVDDDLAFIGTANMDNRSFRINFEITAVLHDREAAAAVDKMLRQDFNRSQAVGSPSRLMSTWLARLAVRLSRLLSPLQ
ncbi:MAG: cardiolipin synthase [Verrucomicrobiota bacterium]|jgi:cardiolipin synthase